MAPPGNANGSLRKSEVLYPDLAREDMEARSAAQARSREPAANGAHPGLKEREEEELEALRAELQKCNAQLASLAEELAGIDFAEPSALERVARAAQPWVTIQLKSAEIPASDPVVDDVSDPVADHSSEPAADHSASPALQARRAAGKRSEDRRLVLPSAPAAEALSAEARECLSLRRAFATLIARAALDGVYPRICRRLPAQKRAAKYRNVAIYRTRKGMNTERLSKVDFQLLGHTRFDTSESPSIFVNPHASVSKPWLGFGGSFTEAAAVALSKMSLRQQEEVVKAYFGPNGHMRYQLCRVPIGSCDFCTGSWTCGRIVDGDRDLSGFSLARYRDTILPLIKKAIAQAGSITLLASPWTPVPWMKTNRSFVGGGALRSDCRGAWALHYVRFIEEMEEAGVPIWGVSVQNEPEAGQDWESCLWTGEQERDFVRDHLGPALEKAGLGSKKIVVWDHNRNGMLERATVIFDDPEAAKYVWGVGYHWYGDARFETWPLCTKVSFDDRVNGTKVTELRSQICHEGVQQVAACFPEKHIIQTESCQELGGRSMSSSMGEWKTGERYAMNIIADMNAGCEGWIDWNLVLDNNGGPNHTRNFCLAPIICDARAGEVRYEPAYWYIGHFARFILPGARRCPCTSRFNGLEVTAFKNLDGSLAIVVLNQTAESFSNACVTVFSSGSFMMSVPSRSITTIVVTT